MEHVLEGAGDLVSRLISALNGVTLIVTLLITNLLSPLPLQVGSLLLADVISSQDCRSQAPNTESPGPDKYGLVHGSRYTRSVRALSF